MPMLASQLEGMERVLIGVNSREIGLEREWKGYTMGQEMPDADMQSRIVNSDTPCVLGDVPMAAWLVRIKLGCALTCTTACVQAVLHYSSHARHLV